MRHIFILAALLCVSCGTQLPSIKPYKLDIQQGNVVTSKMLLQLRPGMTKSQVRFIMGTPLVQDSFHGNRWDYVYQMRENGKLVEQRRVILDFEKELLKSVRGDVIPAGSDQAKEAEVAAPTGTRVVPPVKAAKEKSWMDKLKFWADDEPPAETAAPVKQELKPQLEQAPAAIVAPAPEAKAEAAAKEAPASMLAVPIEMTDSAASAAAPAGASSTAPVLVDAPADVPASPSASSSAVSEPAVAAPVAPAVVDSAPVAPSAAIEQSGVVIPESVPVESAPVTPANPYHYQSPAGMQFDRKLQVEEDEVPVVAEPSGARSGNKVAPTPKPLPPETEPSFFDRMLEQIGF